MTDLFGDARLKVISIRQPYPFLIVTGVDGRRKDIENRSWRTNYRGPLLIHASRRIKVAACRKYGVDPDQVETGGIVGICSVVDCVDAHPSEWFEGPFGFVLRDARPLPFYPMGGGLSLLDPPKEVVETIYQKQIAEFLAR